MQLSKRTEVHCSIQNRHEKLKCRIETVQRSTLFKCRKYVDCLVTTVLVYGIRFVNFYHYCLDTMYKCAHARRMDRIGQSIPRFT